MPLISDAAKDAASNPGGGVGIWRHAWLCGSRANGPKGHNLRKIAAARSERDKTQFLFSVTYGAFLAIYSNFQRPDAPDFLPSS